MGTYRSRGKWAGVWGCSHGRMIWHLCTFRQDGTALERDRLHACTRTQHFSVFLQIGSLACAYRKVGDLGAVISRKYYVYDWGGWGLSTRENWWLWRKLCPSRLRTQGYWWPPTEISLFWGVLPRWVAWEISLPFAWLKSVGRRQPCSRHVASSFLCTCSGARPCCVKSRLAPRVYSGVSFYVHWLVGCFERNDWKLGHLDTNTDDAVVGNRCMRLVPADCTWHAIWGRILNAGQLHTFIQHGETQMKYFPGIFVRKYIHGIYFIKCVR